MERVAVDASALIAILNGEPEQGVLSDALLQAAVLIGAPTLLEVHIWMQRRVDTLRHPWLDDLLGQATTQIVAFDDELELAAAHAYGRFGKGLHPAGLNFGDCMAYAVAVLTGAPLLFKGGDFGKTDVAVHPASVLV